MTDNKTQSPGIIAIVVFYNNEVAESVTCARIRKRNDVRLLVVDNSTKSTSNQEYCKENCIRYISMQGNKGLSKAYNAAIESDTDCDVFIILDDDTDVPDEYFDKLKDALMERPEVDIFVPFIRGQNGIMYSPNSYCFFKNRLIKSTDDTIRQDRFNAISSCMAIRKRVFENYRFNEKLFVDEVDHCFCREQRERNKVFGIINIEVQQHFHQREQGITPQAALNRIRIRITDIFRHARIMGRKYIFAAFVKCVGLGIQLGIKSNSLRVGINAILLSCKLVFMDE